MSGSYPRAIVHIDGDSFFASCEQAMNPALKGKVVITGKERGIASAVSVEGKRAGLARAMPIREIRERCPDAVYLPDDYELYSLMSTRMFAIVRRYTPVVEEYSIDECFADITGLRRQHRAGYADIAKRIKMTLQAELGLTVSVGLAPSKVLAKVASKWSKPDGCVAIPSYDAHRYLERLPVGAVWGIGPQTAAYLSGFSITMASEYASLSPWWVEEYMDAPYRRIWDELNSRSVLAVEQGPRADYQSISKVKTFSPPSSDPGYLLAQVSKNIENACIKARRHGLVARRAYALLTEQSFRRSGCEVSLALPSAAPQVVYAALRPHIEARIRPGVLYRQTGVVLADLVPGGALQADLFGASLHEERVRAVLATVDAIDAKYGKHSVHLAASHAALTARRGHIPEYARARAEKPRRMLDLFRGETARRRINIPYLGEAR
ncbi:DNA polymerase IV [Patescibacteria group bacterium]|nr:DNA polymerase IV [Patescibacteria group bacterium]